LNVGKFNKMKVIMPSLWGGVQASLTWTNECFWLEKNIPTHHHVFLQSPEFYSPKCQCAFDGVQLLSSATMLQSTFYGSVCSIILFWVDRCLSGIITDLSSQAFAFVSGWGWQRTTSAVLSL
jgi:hypothetical protein